VSKILFVPGSDTNSVSDGQRALGTDALSMPLEPLSCDVALPLPWVALALVLGPTALTGPSHDGLYTNSYKCVDTMKVKKLTSMAIACDVFEVFF
jgi:hypothetical protein